MNKFSSSALTVKNAVGKIEAFSLKYYYWSPPEAESRNLLTMFFGEREIYVRRKISMQILGRETRYRFVIHASRSRTQSSCGYINIWSNALYARCTKYVSGTGMLMRPVRVIAPSLGLCFWEPAVCRGSSSLIVQSDVVRGYLFPSCLIDALVPLCIFSSFSSLALEMT